MVGTAEQLVGRAGRMEKAAELKEGILAQVRAEKNAILAAAQTRNTSNSQSDLAKLREALPKSKDEITAAASDRPARR